MDHKFSEIDHVTPLFKFFLVVHLQTHSVLAALDSSIPNTEYQASSVCLKKLSKKLFIFFRFLLVYPGNPEEKNSN